MAENAGVDEQAQDRGEAAGEDDHHAQQHVGLEVVLHVLEEVRPGDKADRGHEEHKAQIFDDLQRLRGVVDLFDDEAGIEACAEKRAVDQRDDKDAGRAEADPLDGDPPEQIADRGDPEGGEHQEIRSVDGSSHLVDAVCKRFQLRAALFRHTHGVVARGRRADGLHGAL